MSAPLDNQNENLFLSMLGISDRILAHSLYGAVPVITEQPRVRDVGGQFEQQLRKMTQAITGTGVAGPDGKLHGGLGIFVTMAHTLETSTKLSSLTAKTGLEVSVLEHRIHNSHKTGYAPGGIGMHSDDVTVGLARYLQNFRMQGVFDSARPQEIENFHWGWVPADLRPPGTDFNLYLSGFEIHFLETWPQPPRCQDPGLAIANGECAITVPAGCAVYYTTDGETYPSQANAAQNAALLYAQPFPVTSGQTVLAVATQAEFDDSNAVGATAP